MPKLAMTQETGTILQWYKNEGESVEAGEPLLEVMTNKINIDVESYVDGILHKRLFEAGDEVPVLDVIAYIGGADESLPDPSMNVSRETTLNEPADAVTNQTSLDNKDEPQSRVRATPAARAEARKLGISLANIQGTGPRSRIQREDVVAYAETRVSESTTTPSERRTEPQENQKRVEIQVVRNVERETTSSQIVPYRGMRKIIGQRMAESAFQAPHVTLVREIDVSETIALRSRLLPIVERQTGTKLSLNTMVLFATAHALTKHPNVNATWGSADEIVQHDEVHLGTAVAAPQGLLVPVIHSAQSFSLAGISERVSRLVQDARNGKLSPDALQGGTFTVSNLGMFGIEAFNPIINSPQVAILGVGASIEKPVVQDGNVVVRPMLTLNLSFDHRVLDGAEAAMFLQTLADILVHPDELLVSLHA